MASNCRPDIGREAVEEGEEETGKELEHENSCRTGGGAHEASEEKKEAPRCGGADGGREDARTGDPMVL